MNRILALFSFALLLAGSSLSSRAQPSQFNATWNFTAVMANMPSQASMDVDVLSQFGSTPAQFVTPLHLHGLAVSNGIVVVSNIYSGFTLKETLTVQGSYYCFTNDFASGLTGTVNALNYTRPQTYQGLFFNYVHGILGGPNVNASNNGDGTYTIFFNGGGGGSANLTNTTTTTLQTNAAGAIGVAVIPGLYDASGAAAAAQAAAIAATTAGTNSTTNFASSVLTNIQVFVTLSPKGLANGLATSANNGAMFGPDTPGTQSGGLQEAEYAIATNYTGKTGPNGGKIVIGPGIVYLKVPVNFVATNATFVLEGSGLSASGIVYTGTGSGITNVLYFGQATGSNFAPSVVIRDLFIAATNDFFGFLVNASYFGKLSIEDCWLGYYPFMQNINWSSGFAPPSYGVGVPQATQLGGVFLQGQSLDNIAYLQNDDFGGLACALIDGADHSRVDNCMFEYCGLSNAWANAGATTAIQSEISLGSLQTDIVIGPSVHNDNVFRDNLFYGAYFCYAMDMPTTLGGGVNGFTPTITAYHDTYETIASIAAISAQTVFGQEDMEGPLFIPQQINSSYLVDGSPYSIQNQYAPAAGSWVWALLNAPNATFGGGISAGAVYASSFTNTGGEIVYGQVLATNSTTHGTVKVAGGGITEQAFTNIYIANAITNLEYQSTTSYVHVIYSVLATNRYDWTTNGLFLVNGAPLSGGGFTPSANQTNVLNYGLTNNQLGAVNLATNSTLTTSNLNLLGVATGSGAGLTNTPQADVVTPIGADFFNVFGNHNPTVMIVVGASREAGLYGYTNQWQYLTNSTVYGGQGLPIVTIYTNHTQSAITYSNFYTLQSTWTNQFPSGNTNTLFLCGMMEINGWTNNGFACNPSQNYTNENYYVTNVIAVARRWPNVKVIGITCPGGFYPVPMSPNILNQLKAFNNFFLTETRQWDYMADADAMFPGYNPTNMPDGLHMNSPAHARIAEAIAAALTRPPNALTVRPAMPGSLFVDEYGPATLASKNQFTASYQDFSGYPQNNTDENIIQNAISTYACTIYPGYSSIGIAFNASRNAGSDISITNGLPLNRAFISGDTVAGTNFSLSWAPGTASPGATVSSFTNYFNVDGPGQRMNVGNIQTVTLIVTNTASIPTNTSAFSAVYPFNVLGATATWTNGAGRGTLTANFLMNGSAVSGFPSLLFTNYTTVAKSRTYTNTVALGASMPLSVSIPIGPNEIFGFIDKSSGSASVTTNNLGPAFIIDNSN